MLSSCACDNSEDLTRFPGNADVLRNGKVASVATFTELEDIEFPGMGKLEAFITSGGLSTTPWSFEGKIKELDYKTIRYPGHYAKFKVLRDLGLLSEDSVQVGTVPSDVTVAHCCFTHSRRVPK